MPYNDYQNIFKMIMSSPQLTDFPAALQVFEENGYEAKLLTYPDSDEITLHYREKDRQGGNQYSIHKGRLPHPSDVDGGNKFWAKVWQDIEIYPLLKPKYKVVSLESWILLTHQLPDDNQAVLAYGVANCGNNKPAIVVASYQAKSGLNPSRNFIQVVNHLTTSSLEEVTHWIPLPEAPKTRF